MLSAVPRMLSKTRRRGAPPAQNLSPQFYDGRGTVISRGLHRPNLGQAKRKLAGVRVAGLRLVRRMDWLGLRVIRVPAGVGVVSACNAAKLAARAGGSWIASRLGSNPAMASLPKPILLKTNRVGVPGSAVSPALPAGALCVV